MRDEMLAIIAKQGRFVFESQNVAICRTNTQIEGVNLAETILNTMIDTRTALFLSGGRTPKDLYSLLADDEQIEPGAVALIDERYGEKLHSNSNENMLRTTGLIQYFSWRHMPFYPVIQENKSVDIVATEYDETIRYLLSQFPRSFGVLGIGLDGHTAGIAGERADFHNPLFDQEQNDKVVSWFDDFSGPFQTRVTMTFAGLSLLDVMLVLVLGDDKKEALEKTFSPGSIEAVPARFFTLPEIAPKVVLITDQYF